MKDALGNQVYKLSQERVVRFTNCNPKYDPQGFCYNLLLTHKPFAREQEIVPEGNNYFVKCITEGLISSTACLDDLLIKYSKYHMWSLTQLDSIKYGMAAQLDTDAIWLQIPDPDEEPITPEQAAAGKNQL